VYTLCFDVVTAAAATCNQQWEDEASRINMNPSRDGIELWHLKGGGGW
jgi:hypothetical protein